MATLKKALIFLLALRLIAIPGYFLIFERFAPLNFISPFLQSNFLFWSWANFDGEHYLSIAKFGYQIRNGFPQYAFFPLLPLLTKLTSFLARDYLVSGLLVVFASLTAILYLLPRWFKLVSKADPKYLELALLLAPGAVFLGSVYTEPLFLALTLAVFYFAEKKRWLPASILAGLATATRVNGLFVALFLIIKLWQARPQPLRSTIYYLLSISGFLSYLTYLYFRTGDVLAWYHAQSYWGKSTATSPLTTTINYLKAVTWEFSPDLTHLVVVFEVALTLWAVYLVYKTIRHRLLSTPYQLYLLGNLALPIATGSLGSMPRFFLLLFPAQIALTTFTPRTRLVVYTIYTMMMVIGVILFTRGHWYA